MALDGALLFLHPVVAPWSSGFFPSEEELCFATEKTQGGPTGRAACDCAALRPREGLIRCWLTL